MYGKDEKIVAKVINQLNVLFKLKTFPKLEEIRLWNAPSAPKNLGYVTSLKRLTLTRLESPRLSFEIGKLVNLEVLQMYGSKIESIPPEIGNCSKLSSISIYTSYSIHYLPYEISRCPISDSTVSRRGIYGCRGCSPRPPSNLDDISTEERKVCLVCQNEFKGKKRIRKMTEKNLGSDKVALLAVCCSVECEESIDELTFSGGY